MMNNKSEILQVDTKIQDFYFIQNFRKEWEEITSFLKSVIEAEKLVADQPKDKGYEIYRPTSSSVVFR